MNTLKSKWFLAFAIVAIHFILAVASAAPETSSVAKDIVNLSSGDRTHDEALKRLKAAPRTEIVETLRKMLKSTGSLSFALRAVDELEVKEVYEEIRVLAKTSESWELFDAINDISDLRKEGRAELAKIYQDRAKALAGTKQNSPLKSSLLDGLAKMDEPAASDVFAKYLADDDFLVRETAVRHLLATRGQLAQEEQVARLKEAFKLKPYQARLEAMNGFRKLSIEDQKKLAAAFSPSLCQDEPKDEVKKVCLEIAGALSAPQGGNP